MTETGARPVVLYVGLRRSELEWRAELDAADAVGLEARVAAETDLAATGLPPERRGRFDGKADRDEQADRITTLAGERPTAVVCWGDKYVGVTARVAARAGLPGTGEAAAATATDKAAQRRALEPLGLNPRWRTGATAEALHKAVADLGFGTPLVFKAAHCSGGRGQVLVTAESDLDAVFALTAENYSGTTDFVIEAFADGSEHSVSGLVRGGEVAILGVTDKRLEGPLGPSRATLTPSALPAAQADVLHLAAANAVRAVGLETGGFHVDLRLTAAGPVVLEVGARLGGDLINSHLIPMSTEDLLRPYESLLRLVSGGDLPDAVSAATRGAAMVLVPKAGRPAADLVAAARGLLNVRDAADWPGTDTVVAIVESADPGALAAVVDDVEAALR